MLIPNKGKAVINKGSKAQWIAQATAADTPKAFQLICNFISLQRYSHATVLQNIFIFVFQISKEQQKVTSISHEEENYFLYHFFCDTGNWFLFHHEFFGTGIWEIKTTTDWKSRTICFYKPGWKNSY
jgi:hypothetical protein